MVRGQPTSSTPAQPSGSALVDVLAAVTCTGILSVGVHLVRRGYAAMKLQVRSSSYFLASSCMYQHQSKDRLQLCVQAASAYWQRADLNLDSWQMLQRELADVHLCHDAEDASACSEAIKRARSLKSRFDRFYAECEEVEAGGEEAQHLQNTALETMDATLQEITCANTAAMTGHFLLCTVTACAARSSVKPLLRQQPSPLLHSVTHALLPRFDVWFYSAAFCSEAHGMCGAPDRAFAVQSLPQWSALVATEQPQEGRGAIGTQPRFSSGWC